MRVGKHQFKYRKSRLKHKQLPLILSRHKTSLMSAQSDDLPIIEKRSVTTTTLIIVNFERCHQRNGLTVTSTRLHLNQLPRLHPRATWGLHLRTWHEAQTIDRTIHWSHLPLLIHHQVIPWMKTHHLRLVMMSRTNLLSQNYTSNIETTSMGEISTDKGRHHLG